MWMSTESACQGQKHLLRFYLPSKSVARQMHRQAGHLPNSSWSAVLWACTGQGAPAPEAAQAGRADTSCAIWTHLRSAALHGPRAQSTTCLVLQQHKLLAGQLSMFSDILGTRLQHPRAVRVAPPASQAGWAQLPFAPGTPCVKGRINLRASRGEVRACSSSGTGWPGSCASAAQATSTCAACRRTAGEPGSLAKRSASSAWNASTQINTLQVIHNTQHYSLQHHRCRPNAL